MGKRPDNLELLAQDGPFNPYEIFVMDSEGTTYELDISQVLHSEDGTFIFLFKEENDIPALCFNIEQVHMYMMRKKGEPWPIENLTKG